VVPLTGERLKICELFAEILHLQYLYTSSPLFPRFIDCESVKSYAPLASDPHRTVERLTRKMQNNSISVAEALLNFSTTFGAHKIIITCLDLFFGFPLNNFLHSVVYDMLAKIFNTFTFALTSTAMFSADFTDTQGLLYDQKMSKIKVCTYKLVLEVFQEGKLTFRITEAQRLNDSEE
jgi:hypothetical protein